MSTTLCADNTVNDWNSIDRDLNEAALKGTHALNWQWHTLTTYQQHRMAGLYSKLHALSQQTDRKSS